MSYRGRLNNAANNTRIIKAGTPKRISRPAGYLLIFCASPTRNGLYDLDLFAVLFDQVPDVDDAIVAGVGTLQASVVRLYGVIVIFGGWVRRGVR